METGAAAAPPAEPEPASSLTLTGLTPGALHQILLQLEEPADLGRLSCVDRLLHQAVAPLAPALFHAAQEGDAGRMQALLCSGSFDRAGLTAAHTKHKLTALHIAAVRGHAEIVSALLEAGAPVDSATPDGKSAVMFAAFNYNMATVDVLRAAGATVDTADAEWTRMLRGAVCRDYAHVVQYLVGPLGVPPDAEHPEERGATALLAAAQYGRPRIVELLLEAGASATSPSGKAALLTACGLPTALGESDGVDEGADFGRIVSALIEHGADKNAELPGGPTALMTAVLAGRKEVVIRLLEEGAEVNAPLAGQELTALMMAASQGSTAIVAALLGAGAAVDYLAPNGGATALLLAAQNGWIAVVDALIAAGTAVNYALPNDGRTALMLAAACIDPEAEGRDSLAVMRSLLAAGADVGATTNLGKTCLILAAISGRTDAVSALLAAGANLHAIDSHGGNALLYADIKGFPDVEAMLKEAGAVMLPPPPPSDDDASDWDFADAE